MAVALLTQRVAALTERYEMQQRNGPLAQAFATWDELQEARAARELTSNRHLYKREAELELRQSELGVVEAQLALDQIALGGGTASERRQARQRRALADAFCVEAAARFDGAVAAEEAACRHLRRQWEAAENTGGGPRPPHQRRRLRRS